MAKISRGYKRIDQNGTYCFTDGSAHQPTLFRFDHPADWSDKLRGRFRGRNASYDELRDFALNETPFINPKAMLAALEKQDLIYVASTDPKRRKGTFNPEKILYIQFKL